MNGHGNDMVAMNESVIQRCLEEAVRAAHSDGFGSALSPAEIEESVMPLLMSNLEYIDALTHRIALSWLSERSRHSSIVVGNSVQMDWQIILLKKAGFLVDVTTVEAIEMNCCCVGFIAEKIAPALVAAVEKLRADIDPEDDDEMCVRPALIVLAKARDQNSVDSRVK